MRKEIERKGFLEMDYYNSFKTFLWSCVNLVKSRGSLNNSLSRAELILDSDQPLYRDKVIIEKERGIRYEGVWDGTPKNTIPAEKEPVLREYISFFSKGFFVKEKF